MVTIIIEYSFEAFTWLGKLFLIIQYKKNLIL